PGSQTGSASRRDAAPPSSLARNVLTSPPRASHGALAGTKSSVPRKAAPSFLAGERRPCGLTAKASNRNLMWTSRADWLRREVSLSSGGKYASMGLDVPSQIDVISRRWLL